MLILNKISFISKSDINDSPGLLSGKYHIGQREDQRNNYK